MNVLIIGINTKLANVFCLLPSNVNILIYKHSECRYSNELIKFSCIYSLLDESLTKFWSRIREIRSIVHNKRIDLIFTNDKTSMIESFLAIRFLNQKPILLTTSHNSYAWAYWLNKKRYTVNTNKFSASTNSYIWLNKLKVYIMSKMINNFTDGYIALASFVSKILIANGVKSSKIFMTSNPIEPGIFKRKTSYKKKSSIINIVYIGVIYEGKGHLALINSIELLKEKGIYVKLTIVGDIIDQVFYENLNKRIKEFKLEDAIHFTGMIDNSELRRTLSDFDLYICPSHMEMSPYNILEAKAAGLPIIATNVGGIPDILTHEIDGLLVPPYNENTIADAIILLASDENLCAKLGAAAYNAALTKHSPENISSQLNDFLSKLTS